MKLGEITALIILASSPGWIPGAARAQNIANGSFEVGIDPNTGAGQNIGMTAPDSATIPGWTVSSGTVDYIGSRWMAGNGVRSLDLSGISAGTIRQTVSGFTPGVAYDLRFLMAANPEGGAPDKRLLVEIGDRSQVFSFAGQGSPDNMGWAERSFPFTATTSTLTLGFTSLEDNASGPALDGVRLATVPEPGTVALGAAACLSWVIGRVGRRLRRSAQTHPPSASRVDSVKRRP
jgi:choice-of-anchor C domain-containing protein